MDENTKAKHELMTKILTWGTIVFFLMVGYALNYHEKFEFFPSGEQKQVVSAKQEQAAALRAESKMLKETNDFVKAAEFNVKAAEADFEARTSSDDMRDAFNRALGLVFAALCFSVFYFFLLRKFYEKFENEMSTYVVSKKVALWYAVVIGVVILYNAIMTSVN